MKPNYGLTIVKDFPVKGVNFIDINGLLNDPACYQAAIDKLCALAQESVPADALKTAAIITPQARGFLFGSPVAYKLGLPLLLVRKKGKIPNKPFSFHITNEYDSYDMEVDSDLLAQHPHYIYIDDIFATGQTLAGIQEALNKKGKKILLALHVTAVPALKGIRQSTPALKNLPTKEIL
ncbi:MAG: hypothetical protein J6Y25_06155 [Elusimicrobiaceae bacterium]|nr:hypothetical protein [Elusimicrobiaceae bacterium]MBP5616559.1 hypothetical protein [Elusimicrobiaceae bacterium]